MPRLLLGIDIGTTATKGIILEPDSGIIAKAEIMSMLRSPHSGWAEEDPRQWWDNVAVVTRKCLGDACARPEEIAAVGVSGMVPTLILLDAEGRVLRASIQQNDARSYQEIDDFLQRVSNEELLERTGSAVTQQSIGPKLLWLRRHEPDVMARAAHLMGSYDYIVYRLTGERSCERNWALESGLFDLGREVWDPVLLELSTIAENLLGRVFWASEVVGRVTRDAADFTGLAEGTVVVAGSADHIASAFSAGLNSPGELLVKLGGAGDILYSLDEQVVDPRLFLDYHVIPGKYFINGCMAASGSIIKWFRRQFAAELDYAALDNGAANLPPGSDGLVLLPYFLGEKTPINDPLARGVFFGLDLRHTRAHLYRAVLEGIAYGFLHHLEVMAERGLKASRARVTNGGTRSMLWKQITSDVLGLPLEQVADHPGSSLGAAFVAGKGAGVFKNWSDIERFISVGETVEANLAAHERYQEFFGVYREIYASLKDTFPALLKATGRNCERCC
jgi:xylulokinase